jgi:uncharacterized membrane protein YkoI
MKKIFAVLSVIIFPASLVWANPEATKEKITRNEAQHIALQAAPNGSVKSANLKHENGHGIWVVEIASKGSEARTAIHVDAMSGKVVSEPAAPAEGKAEKPKH